MRMFCGLLERWREGQAREDRRAGEVVAMLYNINRDDKKDPKGKDWQTWFPQSHDPEVQNEEKMLEAMKMFAGMQNLRAARA